jgi:hypothetical protein
MDRCLLLQKTSGRLLEMEFRSRKSMVVITMELSALLFGATVYGQQSSPAEQSEQFSTLRLAVDGSAPALAFGRYLASLQERNPFTESGPVDVEIDASLPRLAKRGSMLAVRQTGASERNEYSSVRFDGDSTVTQQVIGRYLVAQQEAEALPYSSVAVTPVNYKFRYVRSLETDGAMVYVFQITPKKKRVGLIRGQIWIDSETGIAVHQEGHFVRRPSIFVHRVEIARDTNLRDGLPYTRITHVAVDTRLVGPAQLTITEGPVQAADSPVAGPLIANEGAR